MTKELFAFFLLFTVTTLGYAEKDSTYIVYKTNSKVIYGICFTDRGGALGIADDTVIKVYSTLSNKLLNEFKNGHKSGILSIDISKDSSLLVSGGKDSTIVLWDFLSNRILKKLFYHDGIVTSVHLSPDKRYLVSGGTDKKIFLYDIEKDKVICEFTDHKDDITSVKFSPDGNMVASSGGDGLINIYDVEKCLLIASLNGHRSWVRDISFSRNGTKLISCGDDSRIIAWNITDIKNIEIEESSKKGFNWCLSVDMNEDGDTYVSGGMNGKVRIVTDLTEYVARIKRPVNKVLFKPNEGSFLKVAVATYGKGVFLIDATKLN